jgi:hypothetical protein
MFDGPGRHGRHPARCHGCSAGSGWSPWMTVGFLIGMVEHHGKSSAAIHSTVLYSLILVAVLYSAWFLSILSCLLELRDFQVIFYCGSIVVTIVPRLPEGNPWISGGKLNRLGNWITQEQQKMTTRYNKEYLAWGSRPSNMGGQGIPQKARGEGSVGKLATRKFWVLLWVLQHVLLTSEQEDSIPSLQMPIVLITWWPWSHQSLGPKRFSWTGLCPKVAQISAKNDGCWVWVKSLGTPISLDG